MKHLSLSRVLCLLALPLAFAVTQTTAIAQEEQPETTTQTQAGDVAASGAANEDAEAETRESPKEKEPIGVAKIISDFASTPPLGWLIQGGWFMLPILLMGILAAGVTIERFRSLQMLSTDSRQLRVVVKDMLSQDRIEEAMQLCEREQGPVPAVLAVGLRKYYVLRRLKYDPNIVHQQVMKAMEDYSVHIVAALEKHLPILATISGVASMLGFLGTVQGMISAFNDIENGLGTANVIELAAKGIKVSLMTTCFGLIVGIPAYIAYNYFTGVVNRFVLEVEETSTDLIETVTLQIALEDETAAVASK